MDNQKTLTETLATIEHWETALDKYTLTQLLKKPGAGSWSLGQVYLHLINATLNFHLKQVEVCLESEENGQAAKNFKGFLAYSVLNGFPPIKIKVPPSDFYTPKQPTDKAQILAGLAAVKQAMNATLPLIEQAPKQGKTEHPGFSFLNAEEWYKLVEMHFRHHLRQQARINKFLSHE